MARAKLPDMAESKLFRRLNYMRMQVKFSAGNDYMQFPQVTSRNLTAPAGNLREAPTVRVRVDFFKPSDISPYPVPKNLTKINNCCLKSDFLQNIVDCSLMVVQRIVQKQSLVEIFLLWQI